MGKLFKIIFGVIIASIVLLVVGAVLLAFVVNPNNYKEQIAKAVYQQTGRQLVIKGHIGWSFFPWLGVDLKKVELSNPQGFSPATFADIGELQARAKLWPLLSGHVQLSKFVLKNASFNFIQNKQGVTNWEDWTKMNGRPAIKFKPKATSKKTATIEPGAKVQAAKSEDLSQLANSISIGAVSIVNTNVNFINQKVGGQTRLSNFNLSAKEIDFDQEFPIQMRFKLKQSGSPNIMQVKTNGTVKFDRSKHIINLQKVVVKSQISRPRRASIPVNILGDMNIDFANSVLKVPSLKLQLANINLAGPLTITNFSRVPKISTRLSAKGVSVAKLLRTLSGRSFITGIMNISMTLNTQGSSSNAMLRNLSGKGNLAIGRGQLYGININSMVNLVSKLINTKPNINAAGLGQMFAPLKTSGSSTQFHKLTASCTIRKGILRNRDLRLSGPNLSVSGRGTVNLVRNTISYMLYPTIRINSRNSLTLPVSVSGPIPKPRIKISFGPVIKLILKEQIKNQIKNQIQRGIGKQLPSQVKSLFGF